MGGRRLTVLGREDDLFHLRLEGAEEVHAFLDAAGQLPLPPYITHAPGKQDAERYQTVFARAPGAVAAPTAGLHFDQGLLDALDARGVRRATLTLHVGAGTFQPVRVDNILEHHMHSEWIEVTDSTCQQIRETQAAGKRVIAVGTTSVRCLESACMKSSDGQIAPFSGDTDIFIYPGYEWRCVDALITNFHLPESTLLMLVSAFAGYEHIMQAYRTAVEERYAFFSYGDAMLLTR